MLISLNWIKEFVSLPKELSSAELSEKLTRSTAEVERVLNLGSFWEKVCVAQVTAKEKHPAADKLNIVSFKTQKSDSGNTGKDLKVVCGAPNVTVGMKSIYAPTGLTLPNGVHLEARKIRGVLSEGMLCSEQELGLSEEAEGIIELPQKVELGQNLLDYFQESKDTLFDIDNKSLTHRPDLWGHYGMAREFSTIFRTPLAHPFHSQWEKDLLKHQNSQNNPVQMAIDSKSSCLGYFGLSLSGIQVGPSPDWLQERLEALGLRPINNIVDISNYVMLELGHPLHIFDRDKIEGGKIQIKQVGREEKFLTLDGKEYLLKPCDTVITDEKKTLVLAGIMGGLNSGVSEETQNIFIEVANWQAAQVRKTSSRLGLRTDSSQRFEKKLDSLSMKRTLLRTLQLIIQICPSAQVVGSLSYEGLALEPKPLHLNWEPQRIQKVLGHSLAEDKMIDILKHLGFEIKREKKSAIVVVPSYRATGDIECEADIIEEIGRIVGYDHILPVAPQLAVVPTRLSPAHTLYRKTKDFFVLHSRAFEVNTYPLVGEKLLEKCLWPKKKTLLKLINGLSRDHDHMRPSLVPSLLEAAHLNIKHNDSFRFFELGRAYEKDLTREDFFSRESTQLGVVFFRKESSPFVELVDCIQKYLRACTLPAQLVTQRNPRHKSEVISEDWAGLHPFEHYGVRLKGKLKGALFSLHPLVGHQLKIKGYLSLAIIDLGEVENHSFEKKINYTPLPKFPRSHFDCTIQVDEQIQVGEVLASLKKLKIKFLVSSTIVDIFENPSKKLKYITLRNHFQDEQNTLDGNFLKEAERNIVDQLKKSGFPLKSG